MTIRDSAGARDDKCSPRPHPPNSRHDSLLLCERANLDVGVGVGVSTPATHVGCPARMVRPVRKLTPLPLGFLHGILPVVCGIGSDPALELIRPPFSAGCSFHLVPRHDASAHTSSQEVISYRQRTKKHHVPCSSISCRSAVSRCQRPALFPPPELYECLRPALVLSATVVANTVMNSLVKSARPVLGTGDRIDASRIAEDGEEGVAYAIVALCESRVGTQLLLCHQLQAWLAVVPNDLEKRRCQTWKRADSDAA